jgi:hypothetical protein
MARRIIVRRKQFRMRGISHARLNEPFTAAVFEFVDRLNPSLAFVPLYNVTGTAAST